MSGFEDTVDDYEPLIEDAIKFSGRSHDYFTRVKVDYLLKLTKAHDVIPEQAHFLDIGCGVGVTDEFLVGQVGKLSGVDLHASITEKAAERNPAAEYRVYDGKTLPFDDGSIDVAFAICVMHHVPPEQWQEFCGEAYRVLRPGGLYCIFEHNPWNPFTRWVVHQIPFDKDAVLLSSMRSSCLLRESGFELAASRHILLTPWESRFWQLLDHSVSALPFGAQYYTIGKK
ncbi:MAG: class I SAM-dependent methyltransferase [Coraliomargarita sp.]